ncbi:MAG: hypothetical protein ACQEXJ_18855 [Myxococcota bacterium]
MSRRRTIATTLTALLVVPALGGCELLTREEARVAVEEVRLATEAGALVGATVELTTDLTLGEGVEAAARSLGEFVESQYDCATVTVEGGRVTVDFGTLDDICTWKGQTFAGVVTWKVERAAPDEIVVHHAWADLRNHRVSLNGGATVTWNTTERTRRVVHDATWTVDGRTFEGTGDRTQSLLDADVGIAGGIILDGSRGWTSDTGRWDLAIESVGLRWEDPVPESGRYVLTTPAGKTLTLTFTRVDGDTIDAQVEAPRRDYTFRVNRSGAVSR